MKRPEILERHERTLRLMGVIKRPCIALFMILSFNITSLAHAQTALPAVPAFQLVGSPETVFDWSTQRCEDNDIPDMPARAFRDSDGRVNLLAMHYDAYRMTGDTLNTVTKDCSKKILTSREDPDFADHAYHGWLTSTYTLDGQTIYGVVHNEWYAFLAEPARCSAKYRADGWVNSLTFVISRDKGASYTQPADYNVLHPGPMWSSSFTCGPSTTTNPTNYTRYGAFEPSNIINIASHYYLLFQSEADPLRTLEWGTCLMRTQQLGSAASWEVWTNNGWNTSTTARCSPIQRDKLEKMNESITYNSYLNAYVLIGVKYGTAPGVYYSLSTDLFNWTDPVKILDGSQYVYPSFIDPNDTSRNFEVTGQEAYIYYTRFNSGGGLDRDLVRQKIRFNLEHPGAPTVTITSPLNGGTVPINTVVTIKANASDNGVIRNVRFLVDGVEKCTDLNAPYTCNWAVPRGRGIVHTLRARAIDTSGNSTSHTVKVTSK